jgi:universal stress protein A
MTTNNKGGYAPTKIDGAAARVREILVPLDGSDHALKALRYAVRLAELFCARIHTVQVMESVIYPEGNTIPPRNYEPDDIALKTARGHLSETVARLIPDAVRWQARVIAGHPCSEIIDYGRREKIDLMVITTHGRSGLKHFLMGSSAEQILRHAPCPVLVVRDKEHEFA